MKYQTRQQRPNLMLLNLTAAAVSCAIAASDLTAQTKPNINYQDDIRPILREHCFSCHNPDKKKADLDLTDYESLLLGGSGGEVVAAADPDNSTLWLYTAHQEEPYMPPKKPMISKSEIKLMEDWIKQGLKAKSSSKARIPKAAASIVKVNMSPVNQKPDGPPPMPEVPLPQEVPVKLVKHAMPGSMAASPWAPLIALGYPHQIHLIDAENKKVIGILPFTPGHVTKLKFNQTGELLLAAGGRHAESGQVVIYNIKTGKVSDPIADELDTIWDVALSSDQKLLAIGGTSGNIKVLNLQTQQTVFTIRKKHTDWVTGIGFSPDGEFLASSDRAGNLFIWYTHDGQKAATLKGHKSGITSLIWRPDGQGLITTAKGGYVFFWSRDGKMTKRIKAHNNRITSSALHATKQEVLLATASYDKTIKVLDLNGRIKRTIKNINGPLFHVAWVFNETAPLLATSTDQKVFLLNQQGKQSSIENH